MNVVVTGAGGFSGSHIVRALLDHELEVIAVTGRTRGRLDVALDRNPSLTVVEGNLADRLPLPERIDAIVHAAARSPQPGISDANIIKNNIIGTMRLVDYACAAGARTFINLSSLSAFGRITTPVVSETTPVVDPNVYGMSKLLSEAVLRGTPAPLRSLSIRLPGVIGRGSVRNWLTGVIEAAKEDRDIVAYNLDRPFNNAAHVSDICRFIVNVLEAEWAGHDVVTVAAAGFISVGDAIRTIVRETSSRSSVREVPAPNAGFTVSSERACGLYGYRPMEIAAMLQIFARENMP